jgi:Glycosyltransferase
MKIVMVNPPFKYDDTNWITVPPQGYGGIQWIIKNLIDGLIELGHEIILVGAPGSKEKEHLKVLDIAVPDDISRYLATLNDDIIIHDHSSRGIEFPEDINWKSCNNIIHSHYLVSKPKHTRNLVAASYAHAKTIGYPNIPIIRHPVNPKNYTFLSKKENYLLFMGRVSPWKGTHLAADFAEKAGMKLIIAGPVWEEEYYKYIKEKYRKTVYFYGEVGGDEKKELLAKASATLVLSGGIHTPTGLVWVEPGSQVVSESAISGTPVISTDNGCLSEIVPYVGSIIKKPLEIDARNVDKILNRLPSSKDVRDKTNSLWNYQIIAKEYIKLYEKVIIKQEVW